MATLVNLPYGYYPDPTQGRPVFFGGIYVGNVDTDPTIPINQKQITLKQEDGTTVEVPQPVNTGAGGVPLYNGSPVEILVEGSYSLAVLNQQGAQVYYSSSVGSGDPITEGNIGEFVGGYSNYLFSSTGDMELGNTIGGYNVTYVLGMALKVQDDETYKDYTVVNVPADVDLGGGLWAKEIDLGTPVGINQFSGFRSFRLSATLVQVGSGTATGLNEKTLINLDTIQKDPTKEWVFGNGFGGLALGAVAAVSGFLYGFAILIDDGTTDLIFDDNVTGTNIVNSVAITSKRGVLALRLNASALVADFLDRGNGIIDLFNPTRDYAATNPGIGAVNLPVSIPPGADLYGNFIFMIRDSVNTVRGYLRSNSDDASAVTNENFDCETRAGDCTRTATTKFVHVGGGGNIRHRLDVSDANTGVWVMTQGWQDPHLW